MADNDRFVIIKESEFNRIADVYLKSIGCKYYLAKVKTRAEYEDMIAEIIFKKVYNNYENPLKKRIKLSKDVAKAVVDRLFGEGK